MPPPSYRELARQIIEDITDEFQHDKLEKTLKTCNFAAALEQLAFTERDIGRLSGRLFVGDSDDIPDSLIEMVAAEVSKKDLQLQRTFEAGLIKCGFLLRK